MAAVPKRGGRPRRVSRGALPGARDGPPGPPAAPQSEPKSLWVHEPHAGESGGSGVLPFETATQNSVSAALGGGGASRPGGPGVLQHTLWLQGRRWRAHSILHPRPPG